MELLSVNLGRKGKRLVVKIFKKHRGSQRARGIGKEVLEWIVWKLKILSHWTALCIQCSPETSGKTNLLLKILLKHLNSVDLQNSEDRGCSTFLKLCIGGGGERKGCYNKGRKCFSYFDKDGENVFDIRKLKDLKINGKIGCVGEKDIQACHIRFQMQLNWGGGGGGGGYSDEMICGAVITVITPGSYLRTAVAQFWQIL